MGLKLTVGEGDKITLSCGVVIDVERLQGGAVKLNFEASQDIKIYAIFKDSSKQFKNARRKQRSDDL